MTTFTQVSTQFQVHNSYSSELYPPLDAKIKGAAKPNNPLV